MEMCGNFYQTSSILLVSFRKKNPNPLPSFLCIQWFLREKYVNCWNVSNNFQLIKAF